MVSRLHTQIIYRQQDPNVASILHLNGLDCCSGFPVAHYKGDRFGLVVAFWGLALTLGVPQVSQTDYNHKHKTFGELSNRIEWPKNLSDN